MADKKEKESGGKDKKTPQPSSSKEPVEKATNKPTRSVKGKSDELSVESQVLATLKAIQNSQVATEKKFEVLCDRVKALEEGDYVDYEGQYEQYDECEGYEDGELYDNTNQSRDDCESGPSAPKRSRFAAMTKKLKGHEELGPSIDQTLADNINHVFVNGVEDDQYQVMIRDESIPRPENCSGLATVRCNKLVWDFLSTNAKFHDKKLQNTETSLIKGSILLAQAVNSLAIMESEAKEKGINVSPVVDKCQDALSLFGHANKQLNMARREALRPEMRSQYSHLCSGSKPVTQWLFGDDIEKDAKEIEDTAKIGQKMQYESGATRFHRGRPAFRGRFPRGRAGFRPRGGLGYGGSYDPKNQGRRGNPRFPLKRQ